MPNTITKIRVVFFGSSSASATILEDLLQAEDIIVVAVVTQPTKDHSHTHQRVTRVAQIANDHNIPLLTPHKLHEITSTLKNFKAELGVLFAYGKILPDETLHVFPQGIVNIHPSLLPKHRGPAPLESTILAGDTLAGTSIMLITPEMDAGPILAQTSFMIDSNISKEELWNKLMYASRQILLPTLRDYLTGRLHPKAQDSNTPTTYSQLIKKSDGDIDPYSIDTTTIMRAVRAYAGWPGCRIPIVLRGKTQPLTLHELRPVSQNSTSQIELVCENKQLILHLKDGSLEILRAQLPNKAVVSGRDICNAGPIMLG